MLERVLSAPVVEQLTPTGCPEADFSLTSLLLEAAASFLPCLQSKKKKISSIP